jgi:hypothetical protein
MNASLHMDIAATHVRVRLEPDQPGWLRRALDKLARRNGGDVKANSAGVDNIQALTSVPQVIEETVGFSNHGTRAELVAAIREAGIQALEALRTRAGALDGCGIRVRIGMARASLNLVPMAFAGGATPSGRQLQLIADSVTREALGTSAAAQTIRWQVQPDNEHLCAIAMDTSLLADVQALCKAQHLRLTSCQPAIVEHLDRELAASARRRDTRTLVWTELDPTGRRLPSVSYLRVASGSMVNSWRTAVPLGREEAEIDRRLQATTDRFLIASAAVQDEQLVFCAWPSLVPAGASAATELQA